MLFLKLGFATLGVVYASAVAGMFLLQRDLQYYPSRRDLSPEAAGLSQVERHILPTEDGESVVLWFAPPRAGKPTVLLFHGNAGSISDRAERFAFYQSRGLGVAFLSWRGYGGSSGQPTEAGLLLDAAAALAFLRDRGIAPDKIAIVGESLGSGVAVQSAARLTVGAIVLEAPYTAAVDIAAETYTWLPVRLLMLDQFLSRRHIARITSPLLVLHGERDRTIPFRSGMALFNLAPEPKTFVSLGNVGHDALNLPTTWELGADFIEKNIPP